MRLMKQVCSNQLLRENLNNSIKTVECVFIPELNIFCKEENENGKKEKAKGNLLKECSHWPKLSDEGDVQLNVSD